MHEEYYQMIEELKNIRIEVDLPINDLIEEELRDYVSPGATSTLPIATKYRYQRPSPPPIPGSSARLGNK